MQCLLAQYCCKACQINDWSVHKVMCNRLKVAAKNEAYAVFLQKEEEEKKQKAETITTVKVHENQDQKTNVGIIGEKPEKKL